MAVAFAILAFMLILHLSGQVKDLKQRVEALEARNPQEHQDT